MASVRHSSESENNSKVDKNETDDANEVIDHYYPPTAASSYMYRYMSKSMQSDLVLATYSTSDTRYLCKPIIFNHKTFSTSYKDIQRPNTREGTDEDVKRLCYTFQGLNKCDIADVYVDKTALEIEDILKKAAWADYSDYSCFVVVVLTHGDENELSAYDESYSTRVLWKALIKTERPNPTLAGKPKLFFIQACRGAELDPGQYTMPDNGPKFPWTKKIPLCADILIAYSSFLGYKSVCNTELGSWFIQTLCQCMDQFKDVHDLMTMLTMVQHSVANTKVFQGDKKQIPCIESTLTKKLYLTKSTVIVAPKARQVHGYGTREAGLQRMQVDEIASTDESRESSKETETMEKERQKPRFGIVAHGVVIGILAGLIVRLILRQR